MSGKFTPPTDPTTQAAILRYWANNTACWRSYVTDLICAAAFAASAGTGYAREIQRRRRLDPGQVAQAEQRGEAMHAALADMFPGLTGLALARAACGDDTPDARSRLDATCAALSRYLPPRPPSERQKLEAERARRSGITEEQRQAHAEALAGAL
jgi:hypothetical protein